MTIQSAEYTESNDFIEVIYTGGTISFVPVDSGNKDYQEVLGWVSGGGTIDPYETKLTLDEKKDKKIQIAINKCSQKDHKDIAHPTNGKTYRADKAAMFYVAVLTNNGTLTSGTVAIPRKTGVDNNLTYTEANALFNTIKTRTIVLYAARSAHIVNIKALISRKIY